MSLLRQAEAIPVSVEPEDPLPPHARALLIVGDGGDGADAPVALPAPEALGEALAARLPVLGIEWGMHAINMAFGGRPAVRVEGHASRHKIFLTMGGKVASTIGGAGVVSVTGRHRYGITEARRGKGLMTTAYALDDGVVEALEVPGADRWVIGVQWPAYLVDELPSGFANLLSAFVWQAF